MSYFKGRYGPLLIAEIGGNHEGNFEYAKKLTQLAINSDVDVVKFQLYQGDTIVNPIESPQRNSHFKKFELSNEQHIFLAEMVVNSGKMYTASVWDFEMINWIDKYVSFYKIGSGDLTAYPFLKKIALIGKPIVLSTGISSEEEVLAAIQYIQKINSKFESGENLAIMQCTSMYPINYGDVCLSVINRLKTITSLTIGYSDHTTDSKALKYAYAIGAELLEFHFTDTRKDKIFRDHEVSLTPDEIKELQKELLIISELRGEDIKKPMKIEIDNNHHFSFRRGLYPARNIDKGEIIEEKDLIALRPNHGIDAREFAKIIGKKAMINLKKYQKLSFDYFKD